MLYDHVKEVHKNVVPKLKLELKARSPGDATRIRKYCPCFASIWGNIKPENVLCETFEGLIFSHIDAKRGQYSVSYPIIKRSYG